MDSLIKKLIFILPRAMAIVVVIMVLVVPLVFATGKTVGHKYRKATVYEETSKEEEYGKYHHKYTAYWLRVVDEKWIRSFANNHHNLKAKYGDQVYTVYLVKVNYLNFFKDHWDVGTDSSYFFEGIAFKGYIYSEDNSY